MAYLYRLTSPKGKSYIGVTSLPVERRWREHELAAGKKSNFAVHNAINKYGWENFKKEVLVVSDFDYIKNLEIKCISAFNTKYPNGYNLTDGGEGVIGYTHTEESKLAWQNESYKKNLSEKRVALWVNESYRAKQTLSKVGATLSTQHKTNISISLLGKKRTDAFKLKMKESYHNQKVLICPHCDKRSKSNTMFRWHFDNCKMKVST